MVGLGCDEADSSSGHNIDCDATDFLCIGRRVVNKDDVVYFVNRIHKTESVRHQGDNMSGKGDGDDEQIMVDMNSLPANHDKIIFVVNIYKVKERKQHFGMIDNAFIRICDAETNKKLCRYNLSEKYSDMTAVIFGELYRYNGAWKFNAMGQPTQDNSIRKLLQRFK